MYQFLEQPEDVGRGAVPTGEGPRARGGALRSDRRGSARATSGRRRASSRAPECPALDLVCAGTRLLAGPEAHASRAGRGDLRRSRGPSGAGGRARGRGAEGVDAVVVGGDAVSRGSFPPRGASPARDPSVRATRERSAWGVERTTDAGLEAWRAERLGERAAARPSSGWPTHGRTRGRGARARLVLSRGSRPDEEIVTRITPEEDLREVLGASRRPRRLRSHARAVRAAALDRTPARQARQRRHARTRDAPGAYWAVLGPEVELRRS